MKLVPILLLVVAVVFAAEEKEEDRPKTFRRLIPADVLRGESLSLSSRKVYDTSGLFSNCESC